MTHVLRPTTPDDLPAIYRMAKSTGGGFTSLPADRGVLEKRLRQASETMGRAEGGGDDLFFFVLENLADGRISGTCQMIARVGAVRPFYSYRIDTVVQDSRELGRAFRTETLTLSNDLNGCSEVGGLYLRAEDRSGGVGALLARSRYLFIAMHRARFGARVLAELRGVHDEAGGSPFWDGVAGRFFGMSFQEADRFNARNGTQVIAELMPRHPLYRVLLPDGALGAIGVPHQSGRAAMRMLEAEGFACGAYIDVLDGGPTMLAATDAIRTVREARSDRISAVREPDGGRASIVAAGRLGDFRASFGSVAREGDAIALDRACAAAIGVRDGDVVTHVLR